MLTYLGTAKKEILSCLDARFEKISSTFGRINRWGPDSLGRLRDYIAGGKMIRGGLVKFAHDMASGTHKAEAVALGAAMELFQASFLIHDDIMDRDDTRRGKPSIHSQYAELARNEGLSEPGRIGEALGICAGDVAIFLAFEFIGSLSVPERVKSRLLPLFCRDLSYVGLAQMEDVYQGACSKDPSREAVLSLYTYKTARYTFSLPFAAGLILAEAKDEAVETFMTLGEKLGMLFQIKDDELGLLSDDAELGKPVGSDLSENKKTLHREGLFRLASESEAVRLEEIFGKAEIGREDLAFVRGVLSSRGVLEEIAVLTTRISNEIRGILAGIDGIDGKWLGMIEELAAYVWERKK